MWKLLYDGVLREGPTNKADDLAVSVTGETVDVVNVSANDI